MTRSNDFFTSCSTTPAAALVREGRTILDSDKRIEAPGCNFISALQPVETPVDGVAVNSGLSYPIGTPSRHCWSLEGLTACEIPAFSYSALVLSVKVPGRSKPDIVSIGLAGNGMTARTILYSLRTA